MTLTTGTNSNSEENLILEGKEENLDGTEVTDEILATLTQDSDDLSIEELLGVVKFTEQDFRDIFSNLEIDPMMELFDVERGELDIKKAIEMGNIKEFLLKIRNIQNSLDLIDPYDKKTTEETFEILAKNENLHRRNKALLEKIEKNYKIFKAIFSIKNKTAWITSRNEWLGSREIPLNRVEEENTYNIQLGVATDVFELLSKQTKQCRTMLNSMNKIMRQNTSTLRSILIKKHVNQVFKERKNPDSVVAILKKLKERGESASFIREHFKRK